MIALFVIAVLVAVGLAVVRFTRGPTDVDRIIALDILFAAGIALCAAAALHTQRMLFLDIAIGVALVGFIATLAWARLVERQPAAGPPTEPEA
jgi:multicomponent Na+:H+ antiporter subunit F